MSSPLRRGRLLIDPPAKGAWNMAVDEALLQWVSDGGPPVLRFYRWIEPTLSLGYFQKYEDRSQHVPSSQCPVVRRLSGGGAILHDDELTYSLCLPADDPFGAVPKSLYDVVHETLVAVLAESGVPANVLRQGAIADESPLLCFGRHGPGDVMIGNAKIAGSAQRRRHGAILQHGSVLLRTSSWAPEIPGIQSLGPPPPPDAQLIEPWSRRIAECLGVQFDQSQLDPSVSQEAVELMRRRYAAEEWLVRR